MDSEREAWAAATAGVKAFARVVQAEIKAAAITHSELARRSGVPCSRIRAVLRQQKNGVGLFNLIRLACGLGINASELLRRAECRSAKLE